MHSCQCECVCLFVCDLNTSQSFKRFRADSINIQKTAKKKMFVSVCSLLR